jgi:hypothetical protein
MNQGWVHLIVFFLISTVAALPSKLAADCKDLDPNSEPYLDKGEVVLCRCKQGYTKFNGHCRLVEEVRTRLEERLKNAEAGGRAALYSWGNTAAAESREIAKDALKAVESLANKKGGDFLKQAVTVEVKLEQLFSQLGDCESDNTELRTSCQNIKVFQRLVHETRVKLEKLPDAPK